MFFRNGGVQQRRATSGVLEGREQLECPCDESLISEEDNVAIFDILPKFIHLH